MSERALSAGAYADLAIVQDSVTVAREAVDRASILVSQDEVVLASLDGIASGGTIMALYPRLAAGGPGVFAVAYQAGSFPAFWCQGTRHIFTAWGPLFGPEAVCVAAQPESYIFAFIVRGRIVQCHLGADGRIWGSVESPTDTSQGISRILDDRVITVDEDRVWPAYALHRPVASDDGRIVIGEADGPSARAYVDGQTDRYVMVFSGLAYRPRMVNVREGTYCALAMGDRVVRLRTLTEPFAYEPSEPQPSPVGTVVEMLPYLVGQQDTWPRTGTHPMHQVRTGPQQITFVKREHPEEYEVLSWDEIAIRLVQDNSDGKNQPWSLTANRWANRTMTVGESFTQRGELVRFAGPGDCRVVDRHPFTYRQTLTAQYLAYPVGGDVGAPSVIVLTFDIEDQAGYAEEFTYARGFGWVRWRALRAGHVIAEAVFNQKGSLAIEPLTPCPVPVQEPVIMAQPYPDEQTFWGAVVERDVAADYTEAEANAEAEDRPPPDRRQAFRWFARTAYDIGAAGLTPEASWRKHRAEMREALGFTPDPS